MNWWKEERGERVFVDFNQMARDRTIASAYSVRPNPRARVSAPLRWDEVADVMPDDFDVTTMPTRFAEVGDLHVGVAEQAYSLEPLLAGRTRRTRPRRGRHALLAGVPEDARRAAPRPAQPQEPGELAEARLEGAERAAIDGDRRAGQVRRGRAEHERGDPAELLGVAVAAQRDALLRGGAGLRGVAERASQLGHPVGRDPPRSSPFTRMPFGPSSSAIVFATIASPGRRPFEMARPGIGDFTDEDSTNAIDVPSPPAVATARAIRRPPRKTVSKAWRQSSSSLSISGLPGAADADQRAVERAPLGHRRGDRRSAPSGAALSTAMPTTFGEPRDSAARVIDFSSRLEITSFAPSSARACAVARPVCRWRR